MAVRLAVINCSSLDPEILTYDGAKRPASEIVQMKLASIAEREGIGISISVHRPPADRTDLPPLGAFDALVIPGSKHDIDEKGRMENPWMEDLIRFIRTAQGAGKPMLGICFGHQAIGAAFGSRMGRMMPPKNLELGLVQVELTEEGAADPLFRGVPRRFDAMQYHFRFVEPAPEGSVVLAYGVQPKIIQAFRIGMTTWGVQFHPDYSEENMHEMISRRIESLSKATDLGRVRLDGKRYDVMVLSNFLAMLAR
ncbi:MAG: type 1 glutamine amidotransferase [Candidatus Micrarchaeia archaeon]